MRVYVDVDDVLAQTTIALCALHEQRTGRAVSLEQVRDFDLGVSFGLNAQELDAFFDVVHSDDVILAIEPMPGAAGALERWERSGFEIVVLTGRPMSTEAASREWLVQHGIAHHQFACVDKYGRGGGGWTLEQVRALPFAIAIEDSAPMAVDLAHHCAERVLLYDRPWNRSLPKTPGVERVASWTEIEARVAGR